MSKLTSAILNHDLKGIEDTVAQDRTLLHQPQNGRLPHEWAKCTNNLVTLVRVYRIYDQEAPEFQALPLLKQYINLLGYDEYEPLELEETIQMVWASIFDGKNFKVGKFKRDLIPTEGQAVDLRFLIKLVGSETPEELLLSIKNA